MVAALHMRDKDTSRPLLVLMEVVYPGIRVSDSKRYQHYLWHSRVSSPIREATCLHTYCNVCSTIRHDRPEFTLGDKLLMILVPPFANFVAGLSEVEPVGEQQEARMPDLKIRPCAA